MGPDSDMYNAHKQRNGLDITASRKFCSRCSQNDITPHILCYRPRPMLRLLPLRFPGEYRLL